MNANEIIEKVTGSKLYDISDYIQNWLDWYTGKVKKFHSYTIYNGKKQVQMERMSLGMPKRACEDWANLLLNEKTDITVSDARSQEILHKTLADCKFWQKGNEGIEKSFALGMGAFVTVVDGISVNEDGTLGERSGKVKVKFVNATKIKPITFEDEEITECAFINVNSKKTYISIHLKNEQGNYEIHNITCEGDADNLSIANEVEAHEVFDTQSPLPWFQIIKPNIANNIDINSPLGISIFANAIDNAKETDLVWDSYANEFILGRKRIFVNAKEWYISRNGEEQDVFDSNDVVIYHLPEADDGKQMISDQTQTLRVADHISALQNQLNLFGYKCGLGTEHYKFDGAGVATATQIISVNSEMFRNLKKHEIILNDVLVGMTKSVLYAINTFTPDSVDANAEITIKFDDSIIVDEASERQQDLIDVNAGIMGKDEYRAKWYNEDIETARKAIEENSEFSIDYVEPTITSEEEPAEV